LKYNSPIPEPHNMVNQWNHIFKEETMTKGKIVYWRWTSGLLVVAHILFPH
jgi:hypothetical protein